MQTRSRRNSAIVLGALLFAAATITLAAGCGYYGTSSRTAKDIKSVAVPFFENDTSEPNLEITVTERVINNLVDDNTLKVTAEEYADAVLTGQIIDFINRPFAFNQDLNATEYHVVIRVRATLFNRRKNEPIWSNQVFSGDGSYFVEAVDAPAQTFDGAVEESVREITERILNMTVQTW
jgi:outer membrane lipopolysaccharide assembly protein LptE/RlpB